MPARQAILFERGDTLTLKAGNNDEARLLLFSGKPLNEPIEWGGPIVMNTKEELKQAFKDIEDGTFIKEHPADGMIISKQVNKSFYR